MRLRPVEPRRETHSVGGHSLEPPRLLGLLGLLNLRLAHLVRLVARLGHRLSVLLQLGQGTLVVLVHGLHTRLVGLGVAAA